MACSSTRRRCLCVVVILSANRSGKASTLDQDSSVTRVRRESDATRCSRGVAQSTTKDVELPVPRGSPYRALNHNRWSVDRPFVNDPVVSGNGHYEPLVKGERVGSSTNANGKNIRISANRRRRINTPLSWKQTCGKKRRVVAARVRGDGLYRRLIISQTSWRDIKKISNMD